MLAGGYSGDVRINALGGTKIEMAGNCDNFVIDASGASELVLAGDCSRNVRINALGGAKTDISGRCGLLVIGASGMARVGCGKLKADEVRCVAGSSSNISVCAVKKLTVTAASMAEVAYAGDPEVTEYVSSGAKVRREK